MAPRAALAETAITPIPQSITTPAAVDTSIGTLQFPNGVPTSETAQKVYDELDLQRGVSSFLDGLRGVSMFAARKGIRDAGVADNDVLIFSGLMDARSLFLTANASIFSAISTSPMARSSWGRLPARSASSTICGSAG